MRLHYLQHVPFEDLGAIEPWARDRDYQITSTKLFLEEKLPEARDFDWLVVLGGPMNIYEEDKYPWLSDEKKLIRQAIDEGKIVLGLCLGGQLIADVLGGKVRRNEYKEIGWHPVVMTPDALDSPIFRDFPPSFIAFQWHGDTFEIPPGAIRLAVSRACANQGFEDGRAIGLQFHLEYTAKSIEKIIENCGEELVEGKYIQTKEEMTTQPGNISEANRLLEIFLENVERAFA